MDSLSKIFESMIKYGGVASSKQKVKILPNTRIKMYKPLRYHVPYQKSKQNQETLKIKNSPSSSYLIVNNDLDHLSQYFGNMNMNKKRTPLKQTKQVKFKSSPSPPYLTTDGSNGSDIDFLSRQFDNVKIKKSPSPNVLTVKDDVDDVVKMFEKVKIKPIQKQSIKTKKKQSTKASRRKLPKMNVDISDDDFLSGLLNKSMRISRQPKKPIVQPTRRSTRNIKQPDRYVPESPVRHSQRKSTRIKQKQDKRSPAKLSPIVEERTKKQRKNG
jgi:hypothetical protein